MGFDYPRRTKQRTSPHQQLSVELTTLEGLVMKFVTSFQYMVNQLSYTMSRPTFSKFARLLVGWVFAPRRTITGMINVAGLHDRHHSVFHRVFSKARWSLDCLGLAILNLVTPLLKENEITLVLDDTLARKRGKKVYGAGMHHDPLISSRKTKLVNWGHNWIVLSLVVRFPLWPDRPFALPLLFRLYLNQKTSAKYRRVHRTRPELAVELLNLICNSRRDRRFHVLVDSTYGGQSVLKNLPQNCDLTSRLRLDAWLYDEPPPIRSKRGRRRVKGDRLPTPEEMLESRAKRQTVKIYGRTEKIRLASCRCRLRHVPTRPIKVVATESVKSKRREAFYTTRVDATPSDTLISYSWRWSTEVMFHDTKSYLGFEDTQGWSKKAVERTAPIAMLLYGMIVTWFATYGRNLYEPRKTSWLHHKRWPSFADMLATLRVSSLREHLFEPSGEPPDRTKIRHTLENLVATAA